MTYGLGKPEYNCRVNTAKMRVWFTLLAVFMAARGREVVPLVSLRPAPPPGQHARSPACRQRGLLSCVRARLDTRALRGGARVVELPGPAGAVTLHLAHRGRTSAVYRGTAGQEEAYFTWRQTGSGRLAVAGQAAQYILYSNPCLGAFKLIGFSLDDLKH